MCDCKRAAATLDRRSLVLGTAGAVASAGLAGTLAWPAAGRASTGVATAVPDAKPAPKPIPGGLDIPGIGVIHLFLPGPEGLVLPFSGLPLMGLDVEPSTITDFKGFSAVAYVAGQATGSDGQTYNIETDSRVFRGQYVAEDGSTQRGTFALI